jgi:predicted deacetylase
MEKSHEYTEFPRALVVSIHDVSPLTLGWTSEILHDLERAGIRDVSLLVIPNHHHRAPIARDPGFAEWLRGQCAGGREAVLHGYFHLRESREDDGPWKRIVTGSYTAGEGEFFDLEKPAALELLRRGRDDLDACGVTCTGFIAPAWLLGRDAEAAVVESGFDYTTRIATVSDFRSGCVHRSRSQVWSVRAGWRRACSLAWNAALFRATAGTPLARIGIHPPDWEHPAIRRQILDLAGRAVATRKPMTYGGWLAGMRSGR